MKKRSNRRLRKTLTMLCCALALVAISVGATLAYLTDTEGVTNTFTVGQVNISLDEGDVYELNESGATDENLGKHIDEGETRVQKNSYRLIPGQTYDKDPTIHVLPDTVLNDYQECYVVATVTVNKAAELLSLLPAGNDQIGIAGIVTGGVMDKTYTKYDYSWVSKDLEVMLSQYYIADKDEIEFMIYFTEPVTPEGVGGESVNLVLFENLKIPEEWDNADIAKLQGMEINVTAYAMQAAGFDDVTEAFNTCSAAGWTTNP